MAAIPYYLPKTSVISSFASNSKSHPFLTQVLSKKLTPTLCKDQPTFSAALQASPDSQVVIAVSNPDYKIKVYVQNAADNALLFCRDLVGHTGTISEICWTSNEVVIASASHDGHIALWDIRTGESLTQLLPTRKVAVGKLFCVDSRDNMLVAGGEKGIYVWDLTKGALVSHCEDLHTDDVIQVKFHPTQKHLLFTGSEDTMINVLDLSSGNLTDLAELLDNTLPTEQPVLKMGFFGPNAECLFALSPIATLTLWHIEACELLAQFNDLRGDLNSALLQKLQFPAEKFYQELDNSSIMYAPVAAAAEEEEEEMGEVEFDPVALEADVTCSEASDPVHNEYRVYTYRTSQGYHDKLAREYVDTSALQLSLNSNLQNSCNLILHPSAWRVSALVSCHYDHVHNALRLVATTAYGGLVLSTISPQGVVPGAVLPPGVVNKEVVRDCTWDGCRGALITVGQDAKLSLCLASDGPDTAAADDEEESTKKRSANKAARAEVPYSRPVSSAAGKKNKHIKF